MTSSNGSYLGKAPTEKSSCGSEDGEEVANDAEYGASQVKSMPHRAASHEYSFEHENENYNYLGRGSRVYSQSVVDYTSVTCYLPGVQVFVAIVSSCLSAELCLLVSTYVNTNPVRTLAVSIAGGLFFSVKSMWTLRAKGSDIIFSCMRPAVLIYIASSCVEQIHYSCLNCELDAWGSPNFAKNMTVLGKMMMVLAGFWQSMSMRNKSDMPFVVAILGALVCILFTTAPVATGGPYCTIPNVEKIWNRIAQAISFAWLYAVHVYTYTFSTKESGEMLVCIARATVCSAWVLSCETTFFLLALPQSIMCIVLRTRTDTQQISNEALYMECFPSDMTSRSPSPDVFRKH